METGGADVRQIQQGDVCLERVAAIPKSAKLLPHRVLAIGEVTSHKHQILTETAELYEVETEREGVMTREMFLRCLAPSELTHEEHGPILIPVGEYRVGIVQEWDYLARAARQVMD